MQLAICVFADEFLDHIATPGSEPPARKYTDEQMTRALTAYVAKRLGGGLKDSDSGPERFVLQKMIGGLVDEDYVAARRLQRNLDATVIDV